VAIHLTESAARQIRDAIIGRRGGLGLRLGVRKVGCSGLAYTFDVATEVAEGDHRFDEREATVVVPADAIAYLDGSTLDFVREGFKQVFKVDNPRVSATCGCGESFTIEPDAAPEARP
jgi:iron-sulfur cluster assembly protein